MPEVKTYGLKSIKFGEASEDGTMPVLLTELFRTYRDSVSFVEDDPDIADEYSDQDDDPVISIGTKGKKTIKVSTFDYSPEVLTAMKGGSTLNGQWVEPVGFQTIHKAVEVLTDTDLPFQCPKVQVVAKFNAEFKKKGLALLEITMTPQAPMKIGKKTP